MRIHRVSNSKIISRVLAADNSSVVRKVRYSYILPSGDKYKLKNGSYYNVKPTTK